MKAADHKLRILVVEDCLLTVEQLAEIVRAGVSELTVALTRSEDAAISQLKSATPDLLILDLNLTKGSGFKVLQAAKDLQKSPVVVVLMQQDHPEVHDRAVRMGADYFLTSQSGTDTLSSIVRSVAQHRHNSHSIGGSASSDIGTTGEESSDPDEPLH